MKSFLSKAMILSALGAALVSGTALADNDDILRWQSVIGIIQGGNVVGSGTGAVGSNGQPWSALGGQVRVDPDRARIDFSVRGLVFAGGNSIGTPGTVNQVKGTLVCDTNGSASSPAGNSVFVDTPLVDLSEDGDAEFHGTVASIPAVCVTEPDVAFLIRAASGKWIANGTVLR
jgi:hypothetical protein